MSSLHDARHLKRIEAMQAWFAYDFAVHSQHLEAWQQIYPDQAPLMPRVSEVDRQLQELAPERSLSEINKVDLAILRSIMFEWTTSATPKKVLLDEAVELAKAFGTDSSSRFVNGVLAHYYQNTQHTDAGAV